MNTVRIKGLSTREVRDHLEQEKGVKKSAPRKKKERLQDKLDKKQAKMARRQAREAVEAALIDAAVGNIPAKPGRPGMTVFLDNAPLPMVESTR